MHCTWKSTFHWSCGCINAFFFKRNSYSQHFQFPNGFNAVGAVSSESGNGFNQYAVNPQLCSPASSVGNRRACRLWYRLCLVSIDVNEFPIAVGLYQLGEIFDLRGKGVQLIIGVAAHTGIGTNPDFLFLWPYRRFYDLHLWHSPHRPFCAFLAASIVAPPRSNNITHNGWYKAITTTTKYRIAKPGIFRQ